MKKDGGRGENELARCLWERLAPVPRGNPDERPASASPAADAHAPSTAPGELAVALGWLTPEQLRDALEEQRAHGEAPELLGQILVRRNWLSAQQLAYIMTVSGGGVPNLSGFARLGRYELRGLLGRGGMATVYRARDLELRRDVALKFPDERIAGGRWLQEGRAAARLSHPGIVGVYDVAEHAGLRFLVMELVEGNSLEEIWAGWDVRRKVEALAQVARAVAYAHSQGVIHRDLKPGNVLVESHGQVKVMDFGLARLEGEISLTMTGSIMGTPAYMSPEQVRGERVQTGTDIYSLGVMLYEALAGELPFSGGNPGEVYARILSQEPVRPSHIRKGVSSELEVVCLKAMEKHARLRYGTMEDLADDLRRWLVGEPIRARPASWSVRIHKRVRRNPWAWAGAAGIVATLLVGAAIGVSVTLDIGRERRQRRARAVYEDAQPAFQASLSGLLMGDPDAGKAMEHFEQQLDEAKRIDPDFDGGWFERAQFARLSGREEEAWRYVEEGSRRDPANPLGHLEKGMLLVLRYERAVNKARREASAEGGGSSVWIMPEDWVSTEALERANPALAALRRFAAEELSAGVRAYGGAESIWVKLARAQLSYLEGLFEEAETALRALAYAPARVLMGHLALHRQQYEEAEEWYSKAISESPQFWDAFEARARVRVTLAFRGSGREERAARATIEEALEDWGRVVEARPRSEEAWLGLGTASIHQAFRRAAAGERPVDECEATIRAADRVLNLNPESAEAYNLRGIGWSGLALVRTLNREDPRDCHRQALSDLDRALELNPRLRYAFQSRGFVYLRMAEQDLAGGRDARENALRAVDDFEAVLSISEGSALAHLNRALAYGYLAEAGGSSREEADAFLQQASADIQATFAAFPNWPQAYLICGTLCVSTANLQERRGEDPTEALVRALENFDQGLSGDPGQLRYRYERGITRRRLGIVLEARGEDPRTHYERAIADLGAAGAWSERGFTYLRLGYAEAARGGDSASYYDLALSDVEAAVACAPSDWAAYRTRGLVFLAGGRWSEAVSALEKAYRIIGERYPELKKELKKWIEEARGRMEAEDAGQDFR